MVAEGELSEYFSDEIRAEAFFWRGEVEYRRGNREQAVDDYRRAVELNPEIYEKLPEEIQVLVMPYIYQP